MPCRVALLCRKDGGECWLKEHAGILQCSLPRGPAAFRAQGEGKWRLITGLRGPAFWERGRDPGGWQPLVCGPSPLWKQPVGSFLFGAARSPALEEQGTEGGLSHSVPWTPLETMTGKLGEAAAPGLASWLILGVWAQGRLVEIQQASKPNSLSSSDQPPALGAWAAAATLWPRVTWGWLVAEVPKPQRKPGAQRQFRRAQ